MPKVKKTSVKKAQNGVVKPTYKNLRMGVNAQYSDGTGRIKERTPSKEDSALYRFGFNRGLKGEKEYPGEPSVQKMGRWEGQNVNKKKKTMKSGGSLKPVPADKQKSLGKLPTPVRNKMGFQKDGGKTKAKMGCKACWGSKMKKK